MKKKNLIVRLRTALYLSVAFLLFFFIARENRETTERSHDEEVTDVLQVMGDNHYVVNSTSLAEDVIGYSGTTPVLVSVSDGVIDSVTPLSNSETPMFFLQASQVLDHYKGVDIAAADTLTVDAVTGCTMSSDALIANVRRASLYAKDYDITTGGMAFDLSVKNIIVLIVILSGAIVPLVYRNKTWRFAQLTLNVIVLGLWCGTFISHSLLLGFAENGIHPIASLAALLLLITAFLYPLFGRNNHYCNHLCPYGSAQELCGKISKRKLRLSNPWVKRLNVFRQILWIALITLLLVGVGTEWTNYELFTAFVFSAASPVVITLAVAFLLLSVFTPRPYCRFVCPTGTLFKTIEQQ